MNFLSIKQIGGLAALVAAAGLSACAAPETGTGQSAQQPGHAAAGPMQDSGQPQGQTAAGMSGATASGASTSQGMDMTRMCAMHRDIQNAPPEQRQAMMERHMQQMSPEMRQRHMDMMRQHCQ